MKKVLFATTALIATAGMAAAEVRISGYGRFGLDYNDANDSALPRGVSETTITSRLRLQFDMSAETDSGVTFGTRFRAQAESRNNAPGTGTFNGPRFFATYGGFTVSVGNIIGAVENMPGLYLETRTAGIGIDGAGFVSVVANVNGESFNWDAYSSAGAGVNGLEVLYTAGSFTGHLSYSQGNVIGGTGGNQRTGAYAVLSPGETSLKRFAAMATYTFGDWTASIAAQDSTGLFEDKVALSVSGNIGNFGVRVAYADNDGIGKWGLYGNMDIGAASNVLLFVTDESSVDAADVLAGRNDNRDAVAGSNQMEGTSYGIHYHYDLGGGASFEAGYRRASNDNDRFQAGVYFSF
jgi:outer membrane protein OmpU